MQKLNDEKILGALLAAGSVRKAAKIADVSEATIRNRLNDEAFRTQYEKAKAAVLSEACDAISARLTLAVDTLCEVLDSTETAATVRVSAADSLLRHGLRYIEAANILTRLDALEAKTERQEYICKYYPNLEGVSKINLFGSCIYSGQMALKYLKGSERKTAINKIDLIQKSMHKAFL